MTPDLPPGVESLGDQLEEAAARDIAERPRRRRRVGRFGLPVVAAVVAAAASAGAVRLADRGGDPIEPERGAGGAALQPAADPAVVVASARPDPGGGPPWVLRAYTTPGGRACAQVGRLREGVFGQVQNGRFRALPRSSQATCAAPDARGALIAVERRAAVGLTLVFGLGVDRRAVTVRYGDIRRSVQPVVLGAFLTIFDGADPRQRIVVSSQVEGRVSQRQL